MRLKRLEDIQWQDLPKIESPFFARTWVESNIYAGEGPFQLQGLDDLLRGDFQHHERSWGSYPTEVLLEKVQNAELFLVHGLGSAPFEPIVQPRPDNGAWELVESYSLEVQFNLQLMFEHAVESRGLWEPVAVPATAAPASEPEKQKTDELRVTNPRWEHVDGKRAESSPGAAMAGDRIRLQVDVSGAADGSPVSFKIRDTAISPPGRVGSSRGEVRGGIGMVEWDVKVQRTGAKLEFEGVVRRVSSGPAEIPIIESTPLRLGIFFDGTDNSMNNQDTYSNVAKLYRAYGADEKNVFALYRRGVGTDGGIFNDRDGAAFGNGGQERIEGVLWDILQKIDAYQDGDGELPKRILLDIFGFSRGSATARWLVNVLKQSVYAFEPPYDTISPDTFSIQFLGLFDTVGSFGLPGNDIDCGTCFHIKPAWIEGRVVQLVADDEHRANFDIQTLFREQNDVPEDIEKGRLCERVVPGAHADVGGGYGSGFEHGRTGNQLGRMHLHRMHEEAIRSGVPLEAISSRIRENPNHWQIDPVFRATYETLMTAYETHPGLQREHKVLRELQRGLEWAEHQLDLLDSRYFEGGVMHFVETLRWEDAIKSLRSRLRSQHQTVAGYFALPEQAREFFENYNKLYAGHVHRSHAPVNDGIGMSPEVREDGRLQREVFYDRDRPDKLGDYLPRKSDD